MKSCCNQNLQLRRGHHNNCLIDTMRQSLQRPDGIADYSGYLDLVRRDLATKFPRGPYRVRTDDDPEGANYLEFLQHVRPVVQGLVRHAPELGSLTLDRSNPVWRAENMMFICVDLENGEFHTLPSDTPDARNIIYIARENGNHFVPLRPSNTPLQELFD